MQISVNDLQGRTVVDITGRVLGRVGVLMVDTQSWAVQALTLKLRREPARELGLHWSLFRAPTIEIPTGLVIGASDTVILRAALDELHGLVPEQHPTGDLSPVAI